MKNKRIIIYFLFIFGAMFPSLSYAVDYIGSDKPKDKSFQLVPCDGGEVKDGGVPCDFNALMKLVNRFINFIFYISIPLAAISFSYAGYLYISAAGDTGKITAAHKIFWSVLVGFIFVSSAWLIVYTIQKALLSSDFKNSDANLLRGGGSGNVNGGTSVGSTGNIQFDTSNINSDESPFSLPNTDLSPTDLSLPPIDNSINDKTVEQTPDNVGDFNGTITNTGDFPI